MKAADLHKLWSSPDNSKLTSKQYSFRLPVHVAAKIQALCDIYPNKTRTEIVGDLLSSALEEVKQGLLSYDSNEPITILPDGEEIFEQWGPRVTFDGLTEKYIRELDAESKPSNIVTITENKNASE
jgi:predicted DNA-binding protein